MNRSLKDPNTFFFFLKLNLSCLLNDLGTKTIEETSRRIQY